MTATARVCPVDQGDLFNTAIIPGLQQTEDLVTPAEEQALIARIADAGLAPFRFQQWTGKRLTRSYGWHYDFESGGFAKTDPMPDWLQPFRNRAAQFAGLEADVLVQALLISYEPGAGIGWHQDRPVFEHIIGISLGEPATLRLRRRLADTLERRAAPLRPRASYQLSGEARHDWEHSIAARAAPRWSVTFRSLAGSPPRRA